MLVNVGVEIFVFDCVRVFGHSLFVSCQSSVVSCC